MPLLEATGLVPALADHEAETVARELADLSGITVYSRSVAAKAARVYFLARRNTRKSLCILAREAPKEFQGEVVACAHGVLKLCPTNHHSASVLRATLPYTAPQCVSEQATVGTGDRLGLATPGHIRAVRDSGLTPILAQQSIREMTRTERSPEQVMDDATWGVFEEGFRDGFGADADHLKSPDDIEQTLAAGFRMFTIDPGEYVDNAADHDDTGTLRSKLKDFPWDELKATERDCRKMFAGRTFSVGLHMRCQVSEDGALRAIAKYGRAVAHTARLHRHLVSASNGRRFELEMSVDETDSPTTVNEHLYVAHELKRLGVKVVSLAPRFVGDFEKGIDYKGDLSAFEESFVKHVEIAKNFGPYKISIHSGSDKFSIYPIAARHGGELVHVKTAGTSYLEALRTICEVDPALFREILAFALERYPDDKASYHVSARPEALPKPHELKDDKLNSMLEINDGRQLLHVTYGSVLTVRDAAGNYQFRDRIIEALRTHEDVHYDTVARHIRRHVEPFATTR